MIFANLFGMFTMGIVDRYSQIVAPKNNGSPSIARSSIDQVIKSAQQQYHNALSVNARPCLYFSRKLSGRLCSCSHAMAVNPNGTTGIPSAPGAQSIAPDKFGSPEFIDTMMQGTSFSVNRYGNRPANALPLSTDQSMWDPTLDRKSTTEIDEFSSTVIAESLDDFIEQPAGNNLLNESTKSCSVCMNTGFIGGYDPVNMLRIIYAIQVEWGGVTLDTSRRPAVFQVLFTPALNIIIPKAARNLITLKVWNNRDLVPGVGFYINSCLFTKVWQAQRGSEVRLQLDFSKAPVQEFTHLEVMWDIGMPPVYIEWSNIEYSENLEVEDQISDVNLIIAPTIPVVALYDIIIEDVFNRSWRITNVNTHFDREKHVGGWNVSARLLQKYEIYSILPHMQLRTYWWANQGAQPMPQPVGTMAINPYNANRQGLYR